MFIGSATKARLIRDMEYAWNEIYALKSRLCELEDCESADPAIEWPTTTGPWMADYAGRREVVFAYHDERGIAIQCKDACCYLKGNPGSPTNFSAVTVDEA